MSPKVLKSVNELTFATLLQKCCNTVVKWLDSFLISNSDNQHIIKSKHTSSTNSTIIKYFYSNLTRSCRL